MSNLYECIEKFKTNNEIITFTESYINDINQDKLFFTNYKVAAETKNVRFIVPINNEECQHIYVAPIDMPSVFWTKCTTPEDVQKIMNLYNLNEYEDVQITKTIYGFVNTDNSFTFDVIKNFIYLHPILNKFMWGQKYDNPVIQNMDKLGPFERSLILDDLMEQCDDVRKLSCKTKYSHSIISFEGDTSHMKYISITYKSTIDNENIHKFNELKSTSFDSDIPPDVLSVLMNLPQILQYSDCLICDEKNNIDESNILLAIILATKTTHTTDLLIERFNELSKNTNLSKQSLIQINDFLDRTYVNDVLDIVLKNNKDIVEKITDCKNEKKIKKLMTSIRNKCKFDRKVDEKIIMDQIYHTTMYFIV